jgi:UDP-N-acetyl-D-glucosamine dehydrogenase
MDTAADNRVGADARAAEAHETPTGALEIPAPAAPAGVAVVGLGYVGLPTALVLHEAGFEVRGIDASAGRIETIRAGRADLLMADRERLDAALGDPERFRLTDRPAALAAADAVLVCVPTPVDRNRDPDLAALRAACAEVVARARPGQTLILTSTSHVGATRELLIEPLAERGLTSGRDLCVGFSPERIDPGNDDHRQEEVPRVLGADSARCLERAAAILGPITPRLHVVSSPEAAELTKLHENAFRAVNIAYANEMADMCREFGLDPIEIVDAAATKPYGFLPFYPGAGVGGHCIPCDPHYLLASLGERRRSPVTETAMDEIEARPRRIAGRARELLRRRGTEPAAARVLVVGASYKPGVRDVRESPGVAILSELRLGGADVHFHDPLVERVRLPATGEELECVADPAGSDWDLILIAGADRGSDYEWLNGDAPVLDCTHRVAQHTPELI